MMNIYPSEKLTRKDRVHTGGYSAYTWMGLALGGERFKDEIECLHNRRVRPAKMGRPRLK